MGRHGSVVTARNPDGTLSKSLVASIKQLEEKGIHVKRERTPWYLIDPRPGSRANKILSVWDAISVLALLFTALFTPYEVAFLPSAPITDPLFAINRVVDVVFSLDMVAQFFLMYSDETGWVKDLGKIARRYLRTWFTIDLVSVGIAGLDIFTALEATNAKGKDKGSVDDSSSSLGQLEILRVVRVLRLIKLARLLRASKLLQRWQTKLNIDYATTALLRCVIGVLFTMHWSACVWALQVTFHRKNLSQTWMGDDGYCVPAILAGDPVAIAATPSLDDDLALEDAQQRFGHFIIEHDLSEWVEGPTTFAPASVAVDFVCVPPLHMYIAATYWAVMTITSIGYGDLSATSRNPTEQSVAAVAMLVGGLIWGYVIATFAGLLATVRTPLHTAGSALPGFGPPQLRHQCPHSILTKYRCPPRRRNTESRSTT